MCIPVPKWNPEFKSRREHILICDHSDLDRHPIPVSFWDGYKSKEYPGMAEDQCIGYQGKLDKDQELQIDTYVQENLVSDAR